MEMEPEVVTDRVLGHDTSNAIVVLQPVITAGMKNPGDLAGLPGQHFPEKYHAVAQRIYVPRYFVHVGNLRVGQGRPDEGIRLLDYQDCGNTLSLAADSADYVRIQCDGCGLSASSQLRLQNIPGLFLHLLIKQMIPSLRFANFTWTKQLGTVGTVADVLGVTEGGKGWRRKGDLGLVLMPGMNTLHDFAGFDGWVKYLIQIKFDQLMETHDVILPELVGPPHLGRPVGGPRYWRRR